MKSIVTYEDITSFVSTLFSRYFRNINCQSFSCLLRGVVTTANTFVECTRSYTHYVPCATQVYIYLNAIFRISDIATQRALLDR